MRNCKTYCWKRGERMKKIYKCPVLCINNIVPSDPTGSLDGFSYTQRYLKNNLLLRLIYAPVIRNDCRMSLFLSFKKFYEVLLWKKL